MEDLVRASAQAGRLVLWEEVARDGAQARTLLSGEERVHVARAQSAFFGDDGPKHLIFAAGFPAVCVEEFDAVRQVVDNVDTCQVACHARSNREDVDAAVRALRGVRHGRITLIVPTSDRLARALLHQSRSAAVEYVRDVVRYARDLAPHLPVDMALMDAPHAEPEALADIAELMTEEGVAVVKLCDSMGELFPTTIAQLVSTVSERVGPQVVLGAHFHNDYGLALANNLQAIQGGIRVVASSWLGLGERNGLAPTEQLLFALAYQSETLEQRLPGVRDLWWTVPSTLGIVPLARQISEWAEVPLKSSDAIVGTGMNVRATGTAFIAPQFFRPFDPEQVLGVGPQVVLTQLASARIVTAVALELGHTLSPEQARVAVQWVKHRAFSQSTSVVPREEFEIFLAGMQVHRAAG